MTTLDPLPPRGDASAALSLTPRAVHMAQPLRWLLLGWCDVWRTPLWSLAHGLVLALFGAALLVVAHARFWLLAGAFSGFLVVAPVLATSLYAISRAYETGQRVNFALVWRTWRIQRSPGSRACLRFGLLLALAGTGWVLTSAALITLFAPIPVRTPLDFLRHVVLMPDHFLFEAWLALGAVMAAPIFASSVLAMPLLLDRSCPVWVAVLTSWRTVLANPAALALWAALIMTLVMLGFATALVGLVLVVPVLGHASWHAYRDLVDASQLPKRTEELLEAA